MSATPPIVSNVQALNGRPANGVKPVSRAFKPRPTDPLFKSKKRPGGVRPGHPALVPKFPVPNGSHAPATNGVPLQNPSRVSPHPKTPSKQTAVSGFSDPTISENEYRDYKIVTTKRDLIQGVRYHILKLISDKPVNLQDESEFVRPVRLYRRDPKGEGIGQPREENQEAEMSEEEKLQKEEISKRKEARQKERQANLAQIAPSAATARQNNFKKKTAYVYTSSANANDQKKRQLVYEEKLPWHIEDFENKHSYVGHYQTMQSNMHSALSFESDPAGQAPRFRLITLEKMYKFAPKTTRQVMTLEEAEAAMKKQSKDPSFILRANEVDRVKADTEKLYQASRLLKTAPREKKAGQGFGDEDQDLDYEADFTDDEDGAGAFAEEDEDSKMAKQRIKADQRKYNHFGNIDEKNYDDEEKYEKEVAKRDRDLNKEMNRKLRKREGNYDMASESDDSYETTDSEEERQRLEEEARIKKEKETLDSGASTKGTNTPAGRKEKHGGGSSDREAVNKKTKNLKRPNSPNQSEASGTETAVSRKKLKKKHQEQEPSASQPVQPPSRPASPPIPSSAPTAPTKKRKSGIRGEGSDTDGVATSDGGRKTKKIKRENGALSPLPASPPPSAAATAATAGAAPAAKPQMPFPTEAEILKAIPPEGILVEPLIKTFGTRLRKKNLKQFLNLAKSVAVFDKETKIWKRK